jgi:hypothetical protein
MDNRYQDEINTWAAANNVLGRLAAIEAAVFPVDTGSDKPAGPAPTADFSYDQTLEQREAASRKEAEDNIVLSEQDKADIELAKKQGAEAREAWLRSGGK